SDPSASHPVSLHDSLPISTATGAGAATAATGLVGRALLARLAEDLAHAFALGRVGFHALARLARQGGQQLGGHRLGRDLLFDEGLDVRQAHRVALTGEAAHITCLAQQRGTADAVDVVLCVERLLLVVYVIHSVYMHPT